MGYKWLEPPIERAKRSFWKHVEKSPNGCWLWTGSKNSWGYGQFSINRKFIASHRFAVKHIAGKPLPDNAQVCHSCDTPNCVNPDHLFIGTNSDNVRDMVAKNRHNPNGNRTKTHCKNGHPYDEENTVYWNGKRACKTCRREQQNARRIQQRASAEPA